MRTCVIFGQQSGPRGGWGTAAKRHNEIFCISPTSKTFQVGKSFRKGCQWRRSFGEGRCCVKSFLWLGRPPSHWPDHARERGNCGGAMTRHFLPLHPTLAFDIERPLLPLIIRFFYSPLVILCCAHLRSKSVFCGLSLFLSNLIQGSAKRLRPGLVNMR